MQSLLECGESPMDLAGAQNRPRENKGECREFFGTVNGVGGTQKRSETDRKNWQNRKTCLVRGDCVRMALKVSQINTKFTFKGEPGEMGERISRVTDKQRISTLCSPLPLLSFFSSWEIKFRLGNGCQRN